MGPSLVLLEALPANGDLIIHPTAPLEVFPLHSPDERATDQKNLCRLSHSRSSHRKDLALFQPLTPRQVAKGYAAQVSILVQA